MLASFLIWGVSLKHPVLVSILFGEFLLHIPCWLCFSVGIFILFFRGSFSYTSNAGFIFIWRFLLHILCWRHFYLGSFSYTSHAGFFFFFNLGSFSYLSHVGFTFFFFFFTHRLPFFFFFFFLFFPYGEFFLHNFMWGFSLTRPFLFVCFVFNLGSFSSTSPAGFIFMRGVSLTHPVLASLLFWEFLLHIPCWLIFFIFFLFNLFNWGVGGIFLTHPLLVSSSFFFFFF